MDGDVVLKHGKGLYRPVVIKIDGSPIGKVLALQTLRTWSRFCSDEGCVCPCDRGKEKGESGKKLKKRAGLLLRLTPAIPI